MENLSYVNENIVRLKVPFLDIYTTVFFVKTDEGWLLFDTATYPEDVDGFIVPAMSELGICGADLKTVVVSHNHRDHAGGLARLYELFPNVEIAAGSEECRERVPGATVRVLCEGEKVLDRLESIFIRGHERDCIGIVDTRTGVLLSGDGLQLYGIFGSGNWGANIDVLPEHFIDIEKIRGMGLSEIIAAHDFYPCGWRAVGKEEIGKFLDECANALYSVRDYIRKNPEIDDDTHLAETYNEQSGLPKVGRHVFSAVRNVLCK